MKRSLVVAGLALTGLSGCGTQHSIGVVLGPGERATTVVLGLRPRVEVATGPAPVHVTVRQKGKAAEEEDVQGVMSRRLSGDTEIGLENRGKETAQVQVRTFDATGLALERGK